MTVAFEQIIAMGGLMTEDDYKYEDKQKVKVQINGYLNITSDENGRISSNQFDI